MATSTPRTGEGSNQLTIDTDRKQAFLGDNYFEIGATVTPSGADLEIAQYQLMGRDSSGTLNVLKSAATDGSQFPVGIAAQAYTVPDGTTIDITICNKGFVDDSLIVFDGTDDMDTAVSDRILRDRIGADTVGITLVTSTENTIVDN